MTTETQIDPARVKQRVEGRSAAGMASDFARECLATLATETAQDAFWRALRDMLPECVVMIEAIPERPAPMGDAESRAFGQERMKFGQHIAQRIDDVPLDYLEWLSEQTDEFKADLRRYVQSRRVRAEQTFDGLNDCEVGE